MKTRKQLQAEPIWYLKALAHSAYLQTDHWRLRRAAFLETRGDTPSCDFCGLADIDAITIEESWFVDQFGNECSGRRKHARLLSRNRWIKRQPGWHVHHLNYERIGEELDSDLELLCAPCHNLKHFPHSAAAHHWAATRGVAFKAPIPQERPDTRSRGFLPVEDVPEVPTPEPLDQFVDLERYPDPFALTEEPT